MRAGRDCLLNSLARGGVQDGSCNGLQHYAALGLDEIGGAQVRTRAGIHRGGERMSGAPPLGARYESRKPCLTIACPKFEAQQFLRKLVDLGPGLCR